MITYNHEKYIAQAIESALMQKTNFDYEIVIGEDCSTDGTREIVKYYAEKYPEKIRAIFNEKNLGMIPNFINTLNKCRGKYIAMLEGDDYWTDPYKLQKQVDFLESHPDYGLVHTDCDLIHAKGRKTYFGGRRNKNLIIPQDNFYEELLVHNFIATATVCVRSILLKETIAELKELFLSSMQGDIIAWLKISLNSKIMYINESTAVHRLLEESAQHSKNIRKRLDFILSSYSVRKFFIHKYGCSEATKNKVDINYNRLILWYSGLANNTDLAKEKYLMLTKLDQQHKVKYWLYYMCSKYWLFKWLLFVFKKAKIFY